ncbi:MAG: MOSC domain-containing protein [Crocinitomix sp.]|nr:MOSC domain-containing protein [Crocinitomix sp.]
MEVVSVNIGQEKMVSWRGKSVKTGIFKSPINQPIYLGKTDVETDAVIDRRYHGGIDKACYIYSADHYDFWKAEFPLLAWQYGMFGENITVKGLDEKQVQIGDIFYLGNTRVQVSQPRQPCFKLGIRMGTQTVLKKFINQPFPGIYVRVIDEGTVSVGDEMHLSERLHNTLGVLEVWDLLYKKEIDKDLLEFAIEHPQLADACKKDLRSRL